MFWKIQDSRQIKNTETKHNAEKANNEKHSKTKLPWFSHLLWQMARKRGGLILQRSQSHTGHTKLCIKLVFFIQVLNVEVLAAKCQRSQEDWS